MYSRLDNLTSNDYGTSNIDDVLSKNLVAVPQRWMKDILWRVVIPSEQLLGAWATILCDIEKKAVKASWGVGLKHP